MFCTTKKKFLMRDLPEDSTWETIDKYDEEYE